MVLLFGWISINSGSMHLSDANMALSALLSFISVLSHLMTVQIAFVSINFLGVYLNSGLEMFLSLISLICCALPPPRIVAVHLLQEIGHMKSYSCSGAMLNYVIITGDPRLQLTDPAHTVKLRLSNSPNVRIYICSWLGSREVSKLIYCNLGGF